MIIDRMSIKSVVIEFYDKVIDKLTPGGCDIILFSELSSNYEGGLVKKLDLRVRSFRDFSSNILMLPSNLDKIEVQELSKCPNFNFSVGFTFGDSIYLKDNLIDTLVYEGYLRAVVGGDTGICCMMKIVNSEVTFYIAKYEYDLDERKILETDIKIIAKFNDFETFIKSLVNIY